MYLLYTILYALALILSLPYWLVGMLRDGKYRAGLKERLGFVPHTLRLPGENEKSIWIHAVSVGEVLAISALVDALQKEAPGIPVFVSTTTLTGQKLARDRFGGSNVFYLPLDLPHTVNSFVRAIRPSLLVVAETEFWPNLLRLAKESGAHVVVVNARISDRSLPGYKRFRFFFRRVLERVDLFLTQTPADRDRLITIGAEPQRVKVGGNLKFDIKAPAESGLSRALRHAIASDQRVLVFGSTVESEEDLLIPSFKAVLRDFPQCLIILAPRHPERFDAVAELLRTSGLSFWRRSAWNSARLTGGVLLLDTIGELASVYSLADIAIVGGSFVGRGGHNILEPAQFAKPIVVGPHYENFRDIVRAFLAYDAVRVAEAEQLPKMILELLQSPEESKRLGSRAWHVIQGGRGSTQRTAQTLRELLAEDTASAQKFGAPHA
ncbi:MAG: 3-deoxy-D-manno-octulosonic acid transferase [Terriglobales bacterium]